MPEAVSVLRGFEGTQGSLGGSRRVARCFAGRVGFLIITGVPFSGGVFRVMMRVPDGGSAEVLRWLMDSANPI